MSLMWGKPRLWISGMLDYWKNKSFENIMRVFMHYYSLPAGWHFPVITSFIISSAIPFFESQI